MPYVDRLIIGISRHPAVSATDRQMAPGAYNYNLEFVRFEISLFIHFGNFEHVIRLISYFSNPTGLFLFVF